MDGDLLVPPPDPPKLHTSALCPPPCPALAGTAGWPKTSGSTFGSLRGKATIPSLCQPARTRRGTHPRCSRPGLTPRGHNYLAESASLHKGHQETATANPQAPQARGGAGAMPEESSGGIWAEWPVWWKAALNADAERRGLP